MSIDLDNVKSAAEALKRLNDDEFKFLKTYLSLTWRVPVDTVLPGLEHPKQPEGRGGSRPDPRGRYKCGYCDKVLPTKRGRKIHEKMHERETAPEKKAVTP